LSGKVAAITGGASGIGEATLRLFIEEGARVAFADRDCERGERIAAELQASGAEVLFVEAQMQRETDATAFIQQAEAHFGHLHILVNNAGIRMYQRVTEASEASWDTMLGVNLKGYAFCAKAAIPVMQRAGGGTIVNVASIRSVVAGSGTVQYDTTKAAVAGLTRAPWHAIMRQTVFASMPWGRVPSGHVFTNSEPPRSGRPLAAFLEEFAARLCSNGPVPRGSRTLHFVSCLDDASFVTGTLLLLTAGIRRWDWWPSVTGGRPYRRSLASTCDAAHSRRRRPLDKSSTTGYGRSHNRLRIVARERHCVTTPSAQAGSPLTGFYGGSA
jgi:dihydroanticapsin dehydrogenase